MIKEFTIGFSRTVNLGNYESARVEASVKIDIDETDASTSFEQVVARAQADLRTLLEQTWKAQYEYTTQRMKK